MLLWVPFLESIYADVTISGMVISPTGRVKLNQPDVQTVPLIYVAIGLVDSINGVSERMHLQDRST